MRFDGDDYTPERDDQRLSAQYSTIFEFMKDSQWRPLYVIADALDYPPASVSAQLRHMRKARFGGHTVNRRYIGGGLYEYQLVTKEVS